MGFGAFLCSSAGGTVPRKWEGAFSRGWSTVQQAALVEGLGDTAGRYQLLVWLKPASELALQLAE